MVPAYLGLQVSPDADIATFWGHGALDEPVRTRTTARCSGSNG